MIAPPGAGKGTQGRELGMTECGILLSVDAMRPVEQVSREILTALEAMHTEQPSENDLASLGEAFGHASSVPRGVPFRE